MAGPVINAIQKIFGSAPAPQPPVPQQVSNNPSNNPAPPAPHASGTTDPNGTVPPKEKESPEDKFSKLWEPTPTDPNAQKEDSDAVTPQQMLEAASKVDFTKHITKDDMTKIAAGGEEAVQTLIQVMNKANQGTYAQSMLVTNKLIEKYFEKAKNDFASQVPNLVKRQSVNDSLLKENPGFNDPAVAPIVSMIQSQLAEKFPKASADELQQMAMDYFSGAAKKLSPPKKSASSDTKDDKGEDWESWIVG
jgi:hypothetical protein